MRLWTIAKLGIIFPLVATYCYQVGYHKMEWDILKWDKEGQHLMGWVLLVTVMALITDRLIEEYFDKEIEHSDDIIDDALSTIDRLESTRSRLRVERNLSATTSHRRKYSTGCNRTGILFKK